MSGLDQTWVNVAPNGTNRGLLTLQYISIVDLKSPGFVPLAVFWKKSGLILTSLYHTNRLERETVALVGLVFSFPLI